MVSVGVRTSGEFTLSQSEKESMSPSGTSPVNVAETTDHAANHAMRWWILAVLGVAQLMVILDNTVVNIALPTAQHALAFSNADRQWVVTAYALAFGSLLLLGGRIGDIFGRKRTLIIGLTGFAGASAIGGASVNFAMLVTARTVQGAFGALLAPSVLALLTTTFTEPRERGKAFAIYGGIAGARRGPGAVARRDPHLLRVMALDPLHQPGLCRRGHDRGLALAEERQGRRPRSAGHSRASAGHGRPVLPGLRLLSRRDHRLEQPLHHWIPGRRGDPAGLLRLARAPGTVPAAPAPGGTGQDQRRFDPGHAARQHGALRGLPVPHLLPAGNTPASVRSRPAWPFFP